MFFGISQTIRIRARGMDGLTQLSWMEYTGRFSWPSAEMVMTPESSKKYSVNLVAKNENDYIVVLAVTLSPNVIFCYCNSVDWS